MAPARINDPRLPPHFWRKVYPSEQGCWLWSGAPSHEGYGRHDIRAEDGRHRCVQAHRLAYKALVGPVADNLTIDHLCRVRCCVNPAHMEPVTMRENTMRGTSLIARQAKWDCCHRGHPLSGPNLKVDSRGRRACRACRNAAQRARYHSDLVRISEAP